MNEGSTDSLKPELSDEELRKQLKVRPRSPTLLNMNWLRERLAKVRSLKEKVEANQYQVDPAATAKAIINEE